MDVGQHNTFLILLFINPKLYIHMPCQEMNSVINNGSCKLFYSFDAKCLCNPSNLQLFWAPVNMEPERKLANHGQSLYLETSKRILILRSKAFFKIMYLPNISVKQQNVEGYFHNLEQTSFRILFGYHSLTSHSSSDKLLHSLKIIHGFHQ